MRIGTQITCFVVVLMAVSACATTLSFERDKYERIGVISVIGNQIAYKYVHAIAFGNKNWTTDADTLEISDFVRDATASALKRNGFDAISINVDSDEWYRRYADAKRESEKGLGFLLEPDVVIPEFGPELKSLIAANNLDAVMVFIPGRSESTRTGERWTNVGDTGFGLIWYFKYEYEAEPYIMGTLYPVDGSSVTLLRGYVIEAFGDLLNISYNKSPKQLTSSELANFYSEIKEAFVVEINKVARKL